MSVAVGLFVLMDRLVSSGKVPERTEDDFKGVDFVRLKREEPLKVKEREIPPEPPPPKEPPPPPKLEIAAEQVPQTELPEIQVPNLNLPKVSGVGAAVNQYAMGPRQSGGNRQLIPRVQFQPQYPTEAAMEGLEGSVTVRITIDKEGNVTEAEIVDFTDREFVRPVQRAVYRWKFVPQMRNGQPVEFTGLWEFPFTLTD
jgi:protein TonB